MASEKAEKKNIFKIHPLTIVSILSTIGILVVLLIIFIPSSKEKIYNSYYKAYRNEDLKFTYNDFYTLRDSHNLVNKSVNSVSSSIKSGKLVIVFVGNPKDIKAVQEVGSYTHEFQKEENKEIKKSAKGIISYINTGDFSMVADRLNEAASVESDKKITPTTPMFFAFKDGKLIANRKDFDEKADTGLLLRLEVKAFFGKILESL